MAASAATASVAAAEATAAATAAATSAAGIRGSRAADAALFEPTGLEQFGRVVDAAVNADKVRCTAAALCCPCYMWATPARRAAVTACRSTSKYLALQVMATTVLLILGNLVRGLTDKRTDIYIEVVALLAVMVLTTDVVLASLVNRKFVYSADWWIDVLAAVSIATDLPNITTALGVGALTYLGTGTAGATLTAAIRDSRRVFRMLRLFRLIPIDRLTITVPPGVELCWARVTCQSRPRIRFLKRLQRARRGLSTQDRFKRQESRAADGMTEVNARLGRRIQFKVAFAAIILIVALPAMSRQTSAASLVPSPFATSTRGPTAAALSSALETAIRTVDVAEALSGSAAGNASLIGAARGIRSAAGGPLLTVELLGRVVARGSMAASYKSYLRDTEVGYATVDLCPASLSPQAAASKAAAAASGIFGPNPCDLVNASETPLTGVARADVSSLVRASALWDLLTTNVLMLVLCMQAVLVQNDVESLLLRPMRRLAAFLRPFYLDGIKLLQSRQWGNGQDDDSGGGTTADDGEALSTRLLLAAAVSLRNRLDQHASARFTSKKIRGMLRTKAKVHGSMAAALQAYKPTLRAVGSFQKAALRRSRKVARPTMETAPAEDELTPSESEARRSESAHLGRVKWRSFVRRRQHAKAASDSAATGGSAAGQGAAAPAEAEASQGAGAERAVAAGAH
ncbi:hypothetical protein FNF31_05644 [Cafeteria roenbergensis]|uniref:Ion transport domain-containing protein n=1 Tax=Cafeteria roenbergensis TaxID=33653 RepID=A0A5A8CBB9_CAFRO|nr:hypothetical protein FNF28_07263 [Cafeteria roenbergensis]KAA0157916.1 hypothetical protein FNF31_05644 [Cafeteria roenbergensis]